MNGRWQARLLGAVVLAGLTVASAASPAGADEPPDPAPPPSFSVAFQGSNGDLWTLDTAGTPHDRGLGMAARTSPSVVNSCAGGCRNTIAFQANTGTLWLLDLLTGAATNTGIRMASGTSPSASSTLAGTVKIAYRGTNGHLWTYVLGSSPVDTALPIRNSPSISQPLNFVREAVIAYQTPTGNLMCLLTGDGQNSCPGVAMDPATSPSIAVIGSTSLLDGVAVAYESADHVLYTYNSVKRTNSRIDLGLTPGAGPGAAADGLIGPDGSGEIQVSFRAVTSALWRVTPAISFQESWTVGVATGTTPSVMPWILAFQGSDGHLWTEASFGAPVQSPALMAAGTSPDLY
ncbi:hypothetical protein ODJ79_27935 [Actinoplanes sp. KI2]|uniref:hypothetical protein n=1 Tax=Actinoplanes sp. KI2 TaxID=2983315 RepID=UPI0021D5FA84|nr:hypothetical protein [Actinoplanes sp. KI2]MCU7727566.1 hypothetical protein [Actinoplanes sp. KI2]